MAAFVGVSLVKSGDEDQKVFSEINAAVESNRKPPVIAEDDPVTQNKREQFFSHNFAIIIRAWQGNHSRVIRQFFLRGHFPLIEADNTIPVDSRNILFGLWAFWNVMNNRFFEKVTGAWNPVTKAFQPFVINDQNKVVTFELNPLHVQQPAGLVQLQNGEKQATAFRSLQLFQEPVVLFRGLEKPSTFYTFTEKQSDGYRYLPNVISGWSSDPRLSAGFAKKGEYSTEESYNPLFYIALFPKGTRFYWTGYDRAFIKYEAEFLIPGGRFREVIPTSVKQQEQLQVYKNKYLLSKKFIKEPTVIFIAYEPQDQHFAWPGNSFKSVFSASLEQVYMKESAKAIAKLFGEKNADEENEDDESDDQEDEDEDDDQEEENDENKKDTQTAMTDDEAKTTTSKIKRPFTFGEVDQQFYLRMQELLKLFAYQPTIPYNISLWQSIQPYYRQFFQTLYDNKSSLFSEAYNVKVPLGFTETVVDQIDGIFRREIIQIDLLKGTPTPSPEYRPFILKPNRYQFPPTMFVQDIVSSAIRGWKQKQVDFGLKLAIELELPLHLPLSHFQYDRYSFDGLVEFFLEYNRRTDPTSFPKKKLVEQSILLKLAKNNERVAKRAEAILEGNTLQKPDFTKLTRAEQHVYQERFNQHLNLIRFYRSANSGENAIFFIRIAEQQLKDEDDRIAQQQKVILKQF